MIFLSCVGGGCQFVVVVSLLFWETRFGRWFSVSGFCCGLRCGQCLVAGNSNSTFTAAFLVLFALVFLGVFVLFSGQKLAFLSLNCCGALRCVGNEKGKKEAEEEKTKKKQKNKKKKNVFTEQESHTHSNQNRDQKEKSK